MKMFRFHNRWKTSMLMSRKTFLKIRIQVLQPFCLIYSVSTLLETYLYTHIIKIVGDDYLLNKLETDVCVVAGGGRVTNKIGSNV